MSPKSSKNVFIKSVQKRDGTITPFNLKKISDAINKAMLATGEGDTKEAEKIANKVLTELNKIKKKHKNFVPTIEGIQDAVEQKLMDFGFGKASKNYILYREERARLRPHEPTVPEHVKELNEKSKKYFRTSLGEFIYYRSYSRWIPEEGRRESWIETVDRYIKFIKKNLGDKLKNSEYEEIKEYILENKAMPSMRLLQFAGKAAETTNVCAYNCSFTAPESFQDIAEIMYISMCGTGSGWTVESQNVQKFPQIKIQSGKKLPIYVIADSKEGWADAFALGMKTWANGEDVEFDFSKLRPAGARLKTMGGKSSGPDPLKRLLAFTRGKILARQGRRLSNLNVHDIICMVGDCVVSGGVRRSAMISLSDLDDDEIRDSKKGQFYLTDPHRSLANNSAVYLEKPDNTQFLSEWISLMKSGSGERGIFNRGSLAKTLPKRRIEFLRKKGYFDASGEKIVGSIGTNPCGEIILQAKQFCNLTEVICRENDTKETLMKKIRVATILGTYQSTLTNFPYLSKKWKKNCEDERLLGVSLTGQWDSTVVRNEEVLKDLKKEALRVNKIYAKRFGINPANGITCVKPSGTVSKTFDTGSGMHPRHAPYYLQRIRISTTDSLFKMLKDQGVPYYPEVGQTMEDANTFVLEFPMKSPKKSIFKDDLTALDQLKHWKMVKENYTEHNPSVTISVGDNEWLSVANWVYENWDIVGGLSFLPRSSHVYQLAPYEEITKEKYEELIKDFPEIDYSKIMTYEKTDETEQKMELACFSGSCDLV
ncbi:MAG: ATP cone domain-containing protein [Patescibacteria group bacterium]|nr:ATP cone domain-containing protein [Patescibacteria group bacterium]